MTSRFNIEFINQLLNKEYIEAGLYLIATPLGNLSDITIRSLNILASSSMVYCEDTRVSKKLITKYGIKCNLKSFHEYNSKKKIPSIINDLKEEKIITLISDAGTPLISDPGYNLVRECRLQNLNVYSLPGPSAVIASLASSGISSESFTFYGFFPRDNKRSKVLIEKINYSESTSIFFESPKRLIKTIHKLNEVMPDREISIVRELTKKNEETIFGIIPNVLEQLLSKESIKGEITVIVNLSYNQKREKISENELSSVIIKNLEKNISLNDLSKSLAVKFDIPKRHIYQQALKIKKEC